MFGVKTKVVKFLKSKIPGLDGPKELIIYPVYYGCNHSCAMCWRFHLTEDDRKKINVNPKDDLTLAEYKKIIKQLPKTVERIELSGGGEPLMYPDILGLMEAIKDKGLEGGLLTNGSLVKGEILKKINEINWDVVGVSFHAASEKVYKKIHKSDDFELVVKNIKDLVKLKTKRSNLKIYLHFVIQSSNYKEIYDFAKMAKTLGVDGIFFAYINANDYYAPKMKMTDDEIKIADELLVKVAVESDLENNAFETLKFHKLHPRWNSDVSKKEYFSKKTCPIVSNFLYIWSNGDVLPCCSARDINPRYNLRKYSLSQIWNLYSGFRQNIECGKYHKICYEFCESVLNDKKIRKD